MVSPSPGDCAARTYYLLGRRVNRLDADARVGQTPIRASDIRGRGSAPTDVPPPPARHSVEARRCGGRDRDDEAGEGRERAAVTIPGAVPLNRSGAALRRAVCRQDGLQQRPTSRSVGLAAGRSRLRSTLATDAYSRARR